MIYQPVSLKRLIVNMPPRGTRSQNLRPICCLLGWWAVIQNSRSFKQPTLENSLLSLVVRPSTLLILKNITKFFDTRLQEDSKAAGRWETAQGGEYFAAGVGGAITGRGADLLIIDDPHSEQDALSPSALESAYEWYTSGPRQRPSTRRLNRFGYDALVH